VRIDSLTHPDWRVFDLETGFEIESVLWADDEADLYEVLLRDLNGFFYPLPSGEAASEVCQGRIVLVPPGQELPAVVGGFGPARGG
jgi:hypothetical protein